MNQLSRPGSSRLAVIAAIVVVGGAVLLWAGSSGGPSTATDSTAAQPVATTATPAPQAPEPTSVGAETAEQAAAIAAKVIADSTAAVQAGAPGQGARDALFTGPALVAANGESRLVAIATDAEKEAKALTDAPPAVLAVSRGPEYPRAMLVQTTRRQSGYPVLNLLVAADAQRGYQVAAGATLLSGASVGSFTLVRYGSPFQPNAAAVGPTADATFSEYARVLAYPAPATGDLPFTDDSFAASVRQQQQAQATALGSAGTFTQTRAYLGVMGGFQMLGDSGSLVFVAQERTDTLEEKTANALTPSPAFALLSGKNVIDSEAKQQVMEFLAFTVPPAAKASLVAAAQQLHAASGR